MAVVEAAAEDGCRRRLSTGAGSSGFADGVRLSGEFATWIRYDSPIRKGETAPYRTEGRSAQGLGAFRSMSFDLVENGRTVKSKT